MSPIVELRTAKANKDQPEKVIARCENGQMYSIDAADATGWELLPPLPTGPSWFLIELAARTAFVAATILTLKAWSYFV